MNRGFLALLCKKTGSLVFLLFGVSFLTFFLMNLAPGDPAEIILRNRVDAPTPEKIEAMRRSLGLEDPFLARYARWIRGALRFDLGTSYRTGDSVAREIRARVPATAMLAVATVFFVVLISTGSGMAGAFFRDRAPDRILQAWAVLVVSVPDYWLGLILIYLFSVMWHWFPAVGNAGGGALVLPVLTLGLSIAAVQGRVLRGSLLEVLSQDYIRFAQAKGVSFPGIVRRHVLKNALLPVVTLWGVSLGHLLGGTVIVETVFAWPGLGKLAVEAVLDRDIPLVQGTVLFMSAVFVIVSQCVDGIYRFMDPRIS